jgi:hypothetical protein
MALKFANNQSLTATTALPSAVPTDNLILISTQTASNSATISFTTGLDINVQPSTNGQIFHFQGSTNGGSTYATTLTSTFFEAYNNESGGSEYGLVYETGYDLAQSTSYQPLTLGTKNTSGYHLSGSLQLFNPSSTTYVKHFIGCTEEAFLGYAVNNYIAGYFNTTSAINAINFKFASGNIADGIIKLYGVKKS